MPADIEHTSFVAHDVDGNRYVVEARRPIGRLPTTNDPRPWRFRTADGRAVRPAASHHLYTIEPDGIPLTTSDPNEPTN